MTELRPSSEKDLAAALAESAARHHVISLGGAFSKRRMNPATRPADIEISTTALTRVLNYEPRDLTISVEAGMRFADLARLLESNRQMVPLDPAHFDNATVGGVVASNAYGSRRRLYGTARDMVIGLSFAKLDGKVAKTGGMVVKNVAGFDLAKLMIGSFGTLAAVTVVNFKLTPMPVETRTFVQSFDSAATCIAERDRVLKGVLQPAAIDILNPAAAQKLGLEGFALLIQAGGSPRVLDRYARELDRFSVHPCSVWPAIREFGATFESVARVETPLGGLRAVLDSTAAPIVAHAGSGVARVYFSSAEESARWTTRPGQWVFEYGTGGNNFTGGVDFELMQAIKRQFDASHLLNPGRLYGRI